MNMIDVALLKACLFSMGVLIGIGIPSRCKKKTAAGASMIFAATYAPLMTKYLGVIMNDNKNPIE